MTATSVRFGTERVLRVDDAPAVTDILAAIERAEPTDEALSEQDVRDELGAPDVDLPRASIGVLDGDRLVGFGVLQFSVPTDVWKVAVVGGVHPDYVGRGIGRRILEILQADARAIRDSEAPGSPGLFRVWVPEGRSRTAALAQALGLETWRYFLRMRRDLSDPLPAPTIPDGVLIRPYLASDELAVMEVSNASFADHWGSTPLDIERWRAEYTEASWFRPELSHVAVIDGQVVGFVFVVEYDAETELRGYRSGYLVPGRHPAPGARPVGGQHADRHHPAAARRGRLPMRRTGRGRRVADRGRPALRAARLRHHCPRQPRRAEVLNHRSIGRPPTRSEPDRSPVPLG